ncbi:MAG TPA: hypothetical protein VGS59_09700 [Candidatus Acidoferrales bacterium]|nr:hypothetical protein [Candidatus Acidoferrales bacterium]
MSDKRKAIVFVIVLFVLGVALGAVGTHMWATHVNTRQARHSRMKDLKDQLHLTPTQAQRFDSFVSDARSKFHALNAQEHSEWEPRDDQVRQQWRAETRAILTADQKTVFDAFMKTFDEERQGQPAR